MSLCFVRHVVVCLSSLDCEALCSFHFSWSISNYSHNDLLTSKVLRPAPSFFKAGLLLFCVSSKTLVRSVVSYFHRAVIQTVLMMVINGFIQGSPTFHFSLWERDETINPSYFCLCRDLGKSSLLRLELLTFIIMAVLGSQRLSVPV